MFRKNKMPPEIMKLIMPDEKITFNPPLNSVSPKDALHEGRLPKGKLSQLAEGRLMEGPHLTFKLRLSNIWLFLSISLGICLILLICLKKL